MSGALRLVPPGPSAPVRTHACVSTCPWCLVEAAMTETGLRFPVALRPDGVEAFLATLPAEFWQRYVATLALEAHAFHREAPRG